MLKKGQGEASKLETVSYVYDESTSSDEREYIRCIEEKLGRTGHHLREEDYPTLASFPDESRISFPDFLDCFVERHKGLCDAMRANGARVLLTGHGGDEVLRSGMDPAPELGDLLAQRRLLDLHSRLQTWSRVLEKPYLQLLWNGAVTLLPRSLQSFTPLNPALKLPPWFDQRFVVIMGLRQLSLGPIDIFGFPLPSSRDQAIGFLSAVRAVSRASYRERGCIEVSHPYLHRPLVEFLQAIPFEQKVRPSGTRSLMRRALRNLLPEKVLNRKTKNGPGEALLRAIAREWSRLRPIFENGRVGAYGYVNTESLLSALERARHGCETNSFALIQTISLEFWLRSLERRRSIVKSDVVHPKLAARLTAVQSEAVLPVRELHVPQAQL
jgi:asparagine synthase (glutamine-hydrolysing)